ncbi:pentatricopeptide repeat-containing protein At3g03580-like isoform X1 [Pyrus x bretschneideri]|uniref:pentatricopeptide repeat-containing protein At3g03580-like isoform X1 n=1 Tax=Pyrus x bretschneideri TaxID=225117 RepID=UPI00202E6535|nr:pentatricopeptide repeat-containing protein At3g03580-like isoform X1 [Pyrus x bretschneideri]XP_048447627.1 pentatricopeptide repeat-containing protein At3g03580-like isoform X1 [Pyrus x bretschneideri]
MKTGNLSSISCRTKEVVYPLFSKALSSAKNCTELHKVHSQIVTSGLHHSVFFSGKLISKYAQLRDPISSLSVFHQALPKGNAYLWNSIIRALIHNGFYSKALDHYTEMDKLNVRPDRYTFPSVINACAALCDLEMGMIVHQRVSEMGFGSDLYIGNAVIDMYCRFGELGKARQLFEQMPERDIVSWNTVISGYSSNGYWEEALENFRRLRMDGLLPDSFSISGVLPACGGLVDVKEGQIVHALIEKIGVHADVLVSNGLLSMYFKFGWLKDAQSLFEKMVVRDSVSWNTVICGYSQLGLFKDSINLFKQMVNEFTPDLLTITSVLRACAHLRDLRLARYVHDYMKRSAFQFDTMANNILIDMYAKCGNLLASQEVFDHMECRDAVSWNSLINGYFLNGYSDEGFNLFKAMKSSVKPDSVSYVMILSISTQLADVDKGKMIHCDTVKLGFDLDVIVNNALVDIYAKCGKIKDSLLVFEIMEVRDVVTWNTIIAACIHYDDCSLGLRMIRRMRNEGVMPDAATMLGILPVCSLLAAKQQGKEIHGCILRLGFNSDVPVGNALIEMYSSCGSLENSIRVYEHMRKKDVVTWTSMCSAYGIYGDGVKAVRTFAEMEATGVLPDHLAFLAVIFSCSHSGLVEEGLAYFKRMKNYKLEPRIEHFACVVDLLSRCGLLAQAEDFIHSMPMKADASIWGSLLSACRASGDTDIVARVSEQIIQLNSNDTGYHVLVSNAYAALGKWDQVRRIRKCMQAKGLTKDPGFSWMEIQKNG